jgi:hypothetical protein
MEAGMGPCRHPLEADLVPALKHIHNSAATTGTGTGAGAGTGASCSGASFQPVIFEEQRIKPGSGGVNALHRCCRARAVSHTNIIHRGTDNSRCDSRLNRVGRQDHLTTNLLVRKELPHKDIL